MDREARIAESALRLMALINKLFPKGAADVIGYVLGRRVAFALRGRPWDLYRRFLLRFPYPQRQHEIEHLCAQMLGVEQRVSLRDGWREEVSPQFGDRGPLSITGFHQVLEQILAASMGVEDDVALTILPFPGEPLDEHALPVPFFSAAEKRWHVPARRRPAWVLERSGARERWAVNICAIAARSEGFVDRGRLGVMRARSGKGSRDLILAHSIGAAQILSPTFLARMQSCGGLLYPSLSVGTAPATRFGEVVLVFDPRLLLESLASSESKLLARPNPPELSLYDSNAKTVEETALQGAHGAALFAELSGRRWSFTEHEDNTVFALGPMLGNAEGSSGSAGAEPVFTAKTMAKLALQKAKLWDEIAAARDPEPIVLRAQRSNFDQHNYLEAKAATVVSAANIVAIVAPNGIAEAVGRALAPLGFQGLALDVPMSEEEQRSHSDAVYDFFDPRATQLRIRYGLEVTRIVGRELGAFEL